LVASPAVGRDAGPGVGGRRWAGNASLHRSAGLHP